MDMKKNGLKLHSLLSCSRPTEKKDAFSLSQEEAKKFFQEYIQAPSLVVAYLDYAVWIGEYENGNFSFPQKQEFQPKSIQKIRIFNQNQELLLWQSNRILQGRIRIDGTGEATDVIDANQVLFGTQKEPIEITNYTKIKEERGIQIVLPGNILKDAFP